VSTTCIFGRRVPKLGDEFEEILPDKYNESPYSVKDLSGITDWVGGVWDLITGKPQSWFDRIDADQKALAIRAAQINALGEAPWTAVRTAYLAQTEGPDIEFLSFSDINAGIDQRLKSLIITKSHAPSDQDIKDAEDYNAQYGRYVDYVTSMVPELAATVAADAAQAKATLGQGKMQSPSDTGKQQLVDELERRAALLGAGLGLGALAYLAVPLLIAMAMSGGGKR
jgi:hypothetical protein